MLSMLNQLLAEQAGTEIRWLHACEHGAQHAFKEEIQIKSSQHASLQSRVWYRTPAEQDVQGKITTSAAPWRWNRSLTSSRPTLTTTSAAPWAL